jgi:outer membrane protein assembly factor BamB
MSLSLRRVLVVLPAVAAVGAICSLPMAFAQKQAPIQPIILPVNPPPPGPGPAGSADAASFDLPKDTGSRRKIEAAHDYIDAKRWEQVVQALQEILDDPQDKFAPLSRKGPDGKEVEVPTSVRAEANRLLAGLPKEGLEVYKAYGEAGPKAAEYLKKAKDASTTEDRLADLGLVVRNYLHTDAGGEAADLLATHYMDRGDFRTAARFYNLLLTRAGAADDLSPETLFRAAYAFNQAGDKAGEAFIWQAARARGVRQIKFGDDVKSIDDLQDYLAGIGPPAETLGRQWAYFNGDLGHTGRGEGGPAFMYRKWEAPTDIATQTDFDKNFGLKVAELFDKASKRLKDLNQPVLPPQFPVTATVMLKKDLKKHSLVLARTQSGIAAFDMTGGKTVGAAPIKGSLEWWMSEVGRQSVFNQWAQAYVGENGQPAQRPGIFFENTTIGTLSTDGDYAYTVEDLAVPPPPQFRMNMGFPGNPNPYNWPADVMDMFKHSRLIAFDLSTGCKTLWEAGGPDKPNEKSELTECYFLGPPLAVNGKLYVLAEKQEEIRLICLENVKGDKDGTIKPKVNFVLPLGTARDSKLQMDVLRRINAAHLSYGEGVLVCPTNLGYLIGIDLLQNSLLWAYPYRDQADVAANTLPPGARIIGPGIIIGPNGQQITQTLPQQGWKDSAPIIQDGKVVFTASDSKSIHCINIKDGAPVWSRPRQEGDLYLGAVVAGKAVVVGSRVVRAYALNNGEESWKVEAGLPSGFGAASDNVYYVPLKEAVNGKQPEICAIDADKGVIVGHSKAHPEHPGETVDAPGNLVFFEGGILSQTNNKVVAYPQVKVKIAEMTEKLKVNPNDVDGLFGRGELSLEEGNLEDAVQDFRAVLKNGAPAELAVKAKSKLYDTLTEYFQHNFDQAEKYQDDYAALCSLDLPATATEAEKAEARRRRTNYLYLLAKGKEGQRKLTDAFDLYMQLNAEAQPDELLSLVDERLVKAAPDVLAQGRIAAMVAGASEEERRPLEGRIASRWKDIQGKNDLGELRKFVSLFGSLFSVGQEARLHLAERLMEDDKDADAQTLADRQLDAERQLSLLRARAQDPETAARAVECLARLNTKKGLLEDAAYYYRLLRDRYPDVRVKDGKSGADLFDEVATDKRLWNELDAPPRFGAAGRLKETDERENFNPQAQPQTYKFAHEGEPLPFFQRYKLTLQFGANHELKLADRTTGEQRWDKPVTLTNKTMFQVIASGNINPQFPPNMVIFPGNPGFTSQPPAMPKFSYMSLGHLVVLPVGHVVVGLDAVTGRKLWEKNLFDPAGGTASPPQLQAGIVQPGFPQVVNQNQSMTVDPRDGSVLVVYSDGWTQRLGQVSPLEGAAVCLQMKDALTAIDPISGRVLWTRADVTSRSAIFGDDQNVFVVELSPEGKPAYTRVFRTYDGATVRAPDFRQAYEDRIRLVGRNILVADKDKEATTLRLYDPLTGKEVWKQAFAAKSVVLQVEEGDLAGVIEPDGLVRIVDLATRKEALAPISKMEAKDVDKDTTYTVLGDASDVYIFPNAPAPPQTRVTTNLMPGTGLRGINVNGEVYAFRREAEEIRKTKDDGSVEVIKKEKGSVHWHKAFPNEQLVVDQFQEMPMLLLTASTMKFQQFGQPGGQSTTLKVIEKRTGKLLDDKDNYNGGPFYSLETDARNGKISFTSPNERISVTLESDKPSAP